MDESRENPNDHSLLNDTKPIGQTLLSTSLSNNETTLMSDETYQNIIHSIGGAIAILSIYVFLSQVACTIDLGENYYSLPMIMLHVVS